ncbi:MAG: alpha/beta hydrolase, partial [Terriglobales bacterium]
MRKEITRLGQLKCQVASPADATPGSAKTSPALFLIHGLGGGIWGWEPFQEYFARHGYRSFAIELPGHAPPDPLHNGNGHRPDEYLGICSVETYALHVAAAMAELGPCIVIGHSMGGLIAQKLAEAHQQLGYVFMASAPPWHMFRRVYAPLWKHLLRHPWRQFLAPLSGSTVVLDHSLQDCLVNNRLPPQVRADVY